MSFAGVSVIADGGLQEPSAVCSGTASGIGYHLLVVEGYSLTKHVLNGVAIWSRRFMLGGYRWFLELYPNGHGSESTDFISLFLTLDVDDEEEAAQPLKVHFTFSFVDQVVGEQAPARIRAGPACDFGDRSWGQPDFIEREALKKSEHLKDDCFTVRCDIIVEDPRAPFIEVPASDMPHHFSQLLETKVGTDVTFMVDGDTFVAHRCVLAARSAVFMAELFGPMKEGTTDNIIQIQDMESSVFRGLLRFMYTDSLPKTKEPGTSSMEVEEGGAEATWLQHLLVAADRYDLQRLKSMCEHQLAKNIDLSSVTTLLALAAHHHCNGLKEACLEFLNVQSATDLHRIVSTSDWQLMSTAYPCVPMPNELIAKLASKV